MKDIAGYEGLYAVTSCGKVWSYINEKFLVPDISNSGYLRVSLYKEGKFKNHYIIEKFIIISKIYSLIVKIIN